MPSAKFHAVEGEVVQLRQTALPDLVDNGGGGAADGTIGAITADNTVKDAVKELSTRLNAVTTALKNAGIIA
jgi:hypothetical protein